MGLCEMALILEIIFSLMTVTVLAENLKLSILVEDFFLPLIDFRQIANILIVQNIYYPWPLG
jgi:hypothetical protein